MQKSKNYSVFKHSIGSLFIAILAGNKPPKIATKILNPKITNITLKLIPIIFLISVNLYNNLFKG